MAPLQVKESVFLPLEPEAAWNLAQDWTRRPEWDVRFATYNPEGPSAEGVAIDITVRMGLMRPKVRGLFRRWAPPHQSAVQVTQSDSKLVPLGAGSWTFEPVEGGTRLTSRFTLDDRSLPRWIPRGLFAWFVRLDTRRSFRRLARLARTMPLTSRCDP